MSNFNFKKMEGADRELKLVPLDSELWEVYRGAYGNVAYDVKLLTGEEKEFDDWDMALVERRQSRQGKEEDMEDTEKSALENLMEGLCHQMTFYEGTYLAMPYLVQILEKKQEEDDVEGQIAFIGHMGFLVATDVPDTPYRDIAESEADSEIMENYHLSILKLQEITKNFLEKHLEEIKQKKDDFYYQKDMFFDSVFAILSSDRKAAFSFSMSNNHECFYGICPSCGDCNEAMEIDIENESDIEYLDSCITPAPSVLGKWDKTSFEDDYVWFSNLLAMAEADKFLKILPYYYGTYKCSECGKEILMMDFMKNYYFEEENAVYENEEGEEEIE